VVAGKRRLQRGSKKEKGVRMRIRNSKGRIQKKRSDQSPTPRSPRSQKRTAWIKKGLQMSSRRTFDLKGLRVEKPNEGKQIRGGKR